jgi:hypothetical protein
MAGGALLDEDVGSAGGGMGSMTSIDRSASVSFRTGGRDDDVINRLINPAVSNRLIDPEATARRNLIDCLPIFSPLM